VWFEATLCASGRHARDLTTDPTGGAMTASVPYPSDPYPAESYPPEVVPMAAGTSTLDSAERAAWWLALSAAVLSVAVGIMVMVWPEATLKVVGVLFGAWLVLHGVVRIVQAITGGGREGTERAILGAVGVFFMIAGVIALRNLLVSLAVIATVIGLMWLISGIVELVSAFGGPGGGYRWWRLALGGLSIVAALVVLVWPDLTLITLVYLTGAWLIVMGVLQVGLVFWARRSVAAS
jgi:uncharacterized membrane protein HdeD (DUF308 family)